MFDEFDFNLLDDPNFKEDAVREEIIAPLLKRLGYKPSGETRVVRSKTLTHPFVRIGTRKHSVTIIPDYTLWHGDTAVLILDAKSPKEDVLDPDHVHQAYSYAIHPEVRCMHFALCNGRQLSVFHVNEAEPLLVIKLQDFEARWGDVRKHLGHRYLLNPALRNFLPDLGFHVTRLGMDTTIDFVFVDFHLYLIARQAEDLYSCSSACLIEGQKYLATFDFGASFLDPMLSCLASPLSAQFRGALSRAPFQASLDLMIALDCSAKLGPPTPSQHEMFRPFLLKTISASRLDRTPHDLNKAGLPEHVFSLRKAFDDLRNSGQ